MQVSFDAIRIGISYSRIQLAEIWGYAGYQAIARGVVTPRDENKIILFVTAEKQLTATQYRDVLSNGVLQWEGPTDHFAEDRIVKASRTGDEIHLFYRDRHHSLFTYHGLAELLKFTLHARQPSSFTFSVTRRKAKKAGLSPSLSAVEG